MKNQRMKAGGALVLAIGALVGGWKAHEGKGPTVITPAGEELHKPYVPTQGDVPTIGYGATHYEDGRRVTMADPPITRQRAEELAAFHMTSVYGRCVVKSLGETLVLPAEVKEAVDHAGQYGCGAWESSPMARAYRAGDYVGACEGYLSYKFMTADKRLGAGWNAYRTTAGKTRYRFDCSTPGNRVCRGVWTRSQGRYDACMAAQKGG